ncbi:MAG TPA: HlyD family efflux transporter periplasmic adaptor subunit [Deltaproteobacteria bacterium]|nr:HlyD family efflux transporter periplasmic adaptor subunit [Deltaproteobacteria bacterium]
MSIHPPSRIETGRVRRGGLHPRLRRPGAHPAARMLRPPAPVRAVAAILALLLPLFALALLAMPWQQAALGTGQVIAFAPQERRQTVEAPIPGRIEAWRVQEGQRVQAGDPLVELRDNDPQQMDRLSRSRDVGERQLQTLAKQVRSYEAKLAAARLARDRLVAEHGAEIAGSQRRRPGLAAEAEVEALQAERLAVLAADGIASTRDAELARMRRDKALAELEALDRQIEAQRQAQAKVAAEGDAKIASAQAELEAARAKRSGAEQGQLELEGHVRRQSSRLVVAPRAGRVLRLHGGPGGGQVKAGDPLLTLVPDASTRAVELYVDGNDMPLIREGEQVRLLFEGWPALQVVGFPGAEAGTYAGQVALVDASDDGRGRFRLVVTPAEGAPPWPDAQRLRQGVRAKGWVLLGSVSLGYELWRRLNGFPALPPVDKGGALKLPSTKKPRAPADLK